MSDPVEIPGMWPYDADIIGKGAGYPRLRAISVVLAAEASKREDVRQFRERYLGGKLLAANEMRGWFESLPEGTRPPARWFTNIPEERLIAVADGSCIIPAELMAQIINTANPSEAPGYFTRALYFASPEAFTATYDFWYQCAPIRQAGGVLDTLRQLADRLASDAGPRLATEKDTRWTPAPAATFVLTGYAPLVADAAYPLPARSGRRQTDKHLQLAAFTAMREAERRTLAARMAEWNSRFPQWPYKNTTNFGWDSRQAIRRLKTFEDEAGSDNEARPIS